jgi:hypothetical protein
MIDKILCLLPTQAFGVLLAALAVWWVEPATSQGMAVLAVLVLALVNAIKQVWTWLLPKIAGAAGEKPKPNPEKPAPLKPKRRPARSA